MPKSPKRKGAQVLCTVLALFLFLSLSPALPVQASQISVKIDTGGTLESALLSEFARNGEVPYEEIERLVVTGNGQLTDADGAFVRENLTNLQVLNLRGFTGKAENAAFRGCVSLESVMLPERFVISREMFYGCSSLEEVVWPVHYQLTKDCFAYCALDFSDGYPNLLNDRNVLTYAANQRPKVYFTMPEGNSGTLSAGAVFHTPYELQTRSGASYPGLIAEAPSWLLTRDTELEVTVSIVRDGERVEELDTSETGQYEITYTLPYTTYADTRTQVYTLTIRPSHGDLTPLIRQARAKSNSGYTSESWEELQQALSGAEAVMEDAGAVQAEVDEARTRLDEALTGLLIELRGAPDIVRVGDRFTLTPAKGSARNRSNWSWDERLLQARFESGAEFTALREGETEIVYEYGNGEKGVLSLTVLSENAQAPAENVPQQAEETPDTGDSGFRSWLFAAGLSLAALLLLLRRRRKNKNGDKSRSDPEEKPADQPNENH
ncbi:leucine-rich repeat domain-containing protein [Ruminococcaceae bacterium OttesenSCG-928-I18]|nr:leucine-rich repeat domain-containing protein [Ruminococcaceae bacterium OttesenSCG-928-I18]